VEQKMTISTRIASCPDLLAAMQAHLNVHPVEIIGVEGIAAGTSAAGPCFIHAKLDGPREEGLQMLEIIVKASSPDLVNQVLELCRARLA
jgi:hypothetical protein